MTHARAFWRNPQKFALLSLCEQRISRKLQRNEERLRALQSERKAALEQAAILADLAKNKRELYDPAPDLAHLARTENGFGFSIEEFTRLLRRKQQLTAVRAPLRKAA
jgi:IS30 family transposase